MKTIVPTGLPKALFPTVCLLLALLPSGFAQNTLIPVVTVQATQPIATVANPGVFTVFRKGDTNATLNVWYDLGGTASNGVDYATIPPHLVTIPAGAISNTIVISPLANPPPANAAKTVVLTLTNSPLMTPVNYEIGSPSSAVVYSRQANQSAAGREDRLAAQRRCIHRAGQHPAPCQSSRLGWHCYQRGVLRQWRRFGTGMPVVLDPPGVNGVTGLVYLFNWQNVPTNDYCLTAVATDNGGLARHFRAGQHHGSIAANELSTRRPHHQSARWRGASCAGQHSPLRLCARE